MVLEDNYRGEVYSDTPFVTFQMPVIGSYVQAEPHPDSGYILNLHPIFCDPNNIEYYTQAEERRRWESRFNIESWG